MKDKLEKIGKGAIVKTEWGFMVDVIIKDYKNSYGKDRWLVEPVTGLGSAWVENVIWQ